MCERRSLPDGRHELSAAAAARRGQPDTALRGASVLFAVFGVK